VQPRQFSLIISYLTSKVFFSYLRGMQFHLKRKDLIMGIVKCAPKIAVPCM